MKDEDQRENGTAFGCLSHSMDHFRKDRRMMRNKRLIGVLPLRQGCCFLRSSMRSGW